MMADTRLLIRCSEEVAKEFRNMSEKEGRKQGKMLERLLHEHREIRDINNVLEKAERAADKLLNRK
jgi:hypothetical protein